MEKIDIFTKIIPAIMIFCLVYYNIRKMQKRAQAMRREHSCGGNCSGCAHSVGCTQAEKDARTKEPQENPPQ